MYTQKKAAIWLPFLKKKNGCKPGCHVDVLIRPDDIVHDDDSSETAIVVERAFSA